MKRTIFTLLLIKSLTLIAQDREKLTIESVEEINTAGNFQFGLGLVELDPQLGLGTSAYYSLSNFKDKFSFEGSYNYTYYGKNQMKSAEILPVDMSNFSYYAMDFGVGYTFKQTSKSKIERIRLDKDHVTSDYKHKFIKSEAIRLGYYAKSFGFRYDQESSEKDPFSIQLQPGFSLLVNDAMLHQQFKMVYLGVSIKESINSRFQIEKYGEKVNLIEKEWLFDVLISIENQLFPYFYNGSSTATITDQALTDAINNTLKASPFGLRMAKRYSKGIGTKFGYEIYGGFYPMYRTSFFQSFIVGAKLNIRFIKPFGSK